jgi:protein O-GlcNAc transferase
MVELSLEQAFSQAKYHVEKGEVSEARKFYQAILTAAPNNKSAQEALATLQRAHSSTDIQGPSQTVLNQLLSLYNSGQLADTVKQAQVLIKQYPDAFTIWNILGAASKSLGDLDKATLAFKKVTELSPNNADGYNNYGVILKSQGKLEKAIEFYNRAILLKPNYADAYKNIGNAFQSQGKLEKAIEAYTKALFLMPNNVDTNFNTGNTYRELGKPEEAIEAYTKALILKPDYAEAYNNMGVAFHDQGKLDKALEAYTKALVIKPDYDEGHYNMGNTLKDQGKLNKAIEAYTKAISFNPNYTNAYNNMGVVLKAQGKLKEAIVFYTKALSLNPDCPGTYNNIGGALQDQGKLEEAIEAYGKALALKHDHAIARSHKIHQQAHISDWKGLEDNCSSLPTLGVLGKAISPFSVLALEDAPERHRLRSENYAREIFSQQRVMLPSKPSQMPKRLRIGYFSADFKDHPVARLIFMLIECHNRNRFEVFGYSFVRTKNDKMREKISGVFDVFRDIHNLSNTEVLETVHEDKIDIAIDLTGYTKDSKTNLFSSRLAPVQINYLGYPGTLGADFMDYIVADPIVIPEDKRQHYSEQIIYLPHTYQPNDNTRAISQKVQTRENMGLPSDGFIFCCFNNNYKISPKEFDIWMRLMAKVEGSVLWLLKCNKWAEQNLKREAEARGISGDRVIFAEKVANSEHLARHRLADLFLDTFNYNAHTTASDALWVGLPVVTKLGEGFAARVAGSLLNAVGLPELITHSEEAYEALILKLATSPKKLSAIKEKLEANRLSKPLFNTEQYTKHLENGYQQAYQRYFEGKEPDTIIVPE